MGPVATVIGAVASVVGTVASVSQARKATKLQQEQQAVATRRSRRQAIREAQIVRAQTVASAQASGAMGSSAVAGGLGSLQSQLGEAMGFSTHMSGLSRDISAAQARSQTWGAVAGLGGSLYGYGVNQGYGLKESFGTLFPRQQQPAPTRATVPQQPVGMASSLRPVARPSVPYTRGYGYGM